MRYLTRWRTNLAAGLLPATGRSVGEIAAQVGYMSEQAFSRAFKPALGQAPTRWRAAGESGDEPPPTRASPTTK